MSSLIIQPIKNLPVSLDDFGRGIDAVVGQAGVKGIADCLNAADLIVLLLVEAVFRDGLSIFGR